MMLIRDPPKETPPELICPICKELMNCASLTPCCAVAHCDDCIRESILEHDESQCPACGKTDIAPDNIVPCRYLRKKATRFGLPT